ncbi:MAG: hypothetical protein J5548_02775 [Prevotella sp.]|nr:hypothetical protein [Prevotella sp.]
MKNNKSYLLIAAVLAFIFALTPTQMLAQENLVDRLNKALNLKLPDNYYAEARKFIEKYKICQSKNVIDYTEKFIVEQMKEDMGINKQDQYLFLLSECFTELTNDYLYYGGDGNDKRYDDYLSLNEDNKWEQCREKYGNGLKAYLNQLSEEARKQSEEARKQSEEARKEAQETLNQIFDEVIKCFKLAPNDKRLEAFKPNVNKVIETSKRYDFDYKAVIHKIFGDETELEKEFLKYFEIE